MDLSWLGITTEDLNGLYAGSGKDPAADPQADEFGAIEYAADTYVQPVYDAASTLWTSVTNIFQGVESFVIVGLIIGAMVLVARASK